MRKHPHPNPSSDVEPTRVSRPISRKRTGLSRSHLVDLSSFRLLLGAQLAAVYGVK